MFYFKYDSRWYIIDSTDEFGDYGVGRLVNHSRTHPNVVVKPIVVDGVPRLFFVAKRNIPQGEELLVDYGERDPDVMESNPWLKS